MKKNPRPTIRGLATALALLAALALGACATSTSQPETSPVEAAPEPAVEPWDGDGLDIPLDGSSMEAWERSLLRVKAHSTPADYQLLLRAIDYLQVYDVGARGNREVLIQRLNGRTGREIVARVNWRR
ncbi:MAG: hypothetical protein P8Y54_10205 [Xanthomonadales bacterium]